MNNHYNKNLKTYARQNRQTQTHGEMVLWSKLRRKQLLNIRFLRQRTIENYIVDFFAPDINLIIEIDGISHSEEKYDYDQNRSITLESLGYRIMRFSEYDSVNNINDVIQSIVNYAESLPLVPSQEGKPN